MEFYIGQISEILLNQFFCRSDPTIL